MSWCPSLLPAVLFAAVSTSFHARAADWTWGGSLSGRVENISNATLAAPPAAGRRRSLTADFDFAVREEAWDAMANAHYALNESNLPQLAQDGYSFGLRTTRRFERDTLGLDASLRRESTLTSELATTGSSFALAQRESMNFAPNWRRSMTERLALTADTSLQLVAYDRRSAALVDSTSASASAGFAYTLSPRTELRLSANASRTRTDPFTSHSNVTGWSASVQHTLDEHWRFSGSYGPTRIRSRFAGAARICPVTPVFCDSGLVPFTVLATEEERVGHGKTWNASATYSPREHTFIVLQTSRAASPSAGGGLGEVESSSAALSHRFSDRLSAGAEIGMSSSSTVSVTTGPGTESRHASANLSWQMDERLSLEAGWRWQQSRVAAQAPESTTLFLALRYSLPRRLLR